MAENLRARGMTVDLCEAQKQVMAPFDFEMAQLLHENIAINGVTLHLGSGVASFEQTEHGIATVLADGTRIEADLVLLSIGLKPNTEIAQAAGIACTERGSIIVDDTMKTTVPHIWAVGDAAQTRNLITGKPAQIRLAGPANKQGRVAASTGLNEKTLQQAGKIKGKDYETVLISQKSHAGYYPKATPMYLKLLFGMDAKILGAQIVGQDGMDKRIDTISALLGKGGTAEDLNELETAYAPPYSSVVCCSASACSSVKCSRNGMTSKIFSCIALPPVSAIIACRFLDDVSKNGYICKCKKNDLSGRRHRR